MEDPQQGPAARAGHTYDINVYICGTDTKMWNRRGWPDHNGQASSVARATAVRGTVVSTITMNAATSSANRLMSEQVTSASRLGMCEQPAVRAILDGHVSKPGNTNAPRPTFVMRGGDR
jgi:hypothetical protein